MFSDVAMKRKSYTYFYLEMSLAKGPPSLVENLNYWKYIPLTGCPKLASIFQNNYLCKELERRN